MFATIDDLESGWRQLTPEENEVAEVLLERASMKLRGMVVIRPGDCVQRENLRTVTCDMVRRAMTSSGDAFGMQQEPDGFGWQPMNEPGNLEPLTRELNLLRSGMGICSIGL